MNERTEQLKAQVTEQAALIGQLAAGIGGPAWEVNSAHFLHTVARKLACASNELLLDEQGVARPKRGD